MRPPDAELLAQAVACHKAGRLEQAAELYQEILARSPEHAEALHFLGLVRIAAGGFEEGVALLRRAIAAQPAHAFFHANLGLALLRAQRHADAVPPLRRAIALDPGVAEPHDRLAGAFALSGRPREAIEVLRAAARRFPRDPRFPLRLSALLLQTREHEAAGEAAEAALALAPGHPDALVNLGLVAAARHDYAAAQERFTAALAGNPASIAAQNGLASAAGRLCDFAAQERAAGLIAARIAGAAPQDSWATLADIAYLCPYLDVPAAAHGRTLDLLAARFPLPLPLPAPPSIARRGDPRLRIGYLSTGFGNHPIGHVTRSLYAAHDRARFQVFGYAILDRSNDKSGYFAAIRAGFDAYRDLTRLDDAAAAAAIRADGIDILVDLNGYLEGCRPGILARRPAPVQAFWLAHAGGLGLPFIDYLIGDPVVVPPGEETLYREHLVRLPEVYHCADAPPIDAAPADAVAAGLAGARFVFCAFNNPQKIDRRILSSWLRILAAVPGSVLWLSDPSGRPALHANLRAAAAAAGIAGERIVFASRVRSKAEHLARHRLAGLFLDTRTVNAATTALDALWAGLPVLTPRGDRWASRMAETMVRALGMGDALVAPDLAAYEERAIALAGDPAALTALKGRLAEAAATQPLFDIARFSRHLERAFEGMWRRYEAGLPPAAFDVEPL